MAMQTTQAIQKREPLHEDLEACEGGALGTSDGPG